MNLYQVDAFTDRAFSGNPAAVVLLEEQPSAEWMQRVAAEMNLAETAFVIDRAREQFDLQWFTPVAEVDLCGHATLASAHVLWEAGVVDPSRQIRFETRSGLLTAERKGEWIVLDFPSENAEPMEDMFGLAAILGSKPIFVGRNRLDVLVELADEASVRALQPDLHALKEIGMRGLIVTARSDHEAYDFVSRYFAPRFGIPEDPVTGSAHCCLGPYWQQRLAKSDLTGYQASARGGFVGVHISGDRVHLKGKAVTVLSGTLLV